MASSRRATDQIRKHFGSRERRAAVFLPGISPTADKAAIDAFAKKLRGLPGVARVDASTGFYPAKDKIITPPFAKGQIVPAAASPKLAAAS